MMEMIGSDRRTKQTKEKTMQIRNINSSYGNPAIFKGEDLPECVRKMAIAIIDSDYHRERTVDDLCWHLRENIDYEVLED